MTKLVVKLRSQVRSSVSVSQPQHQDVDDQQQNKSELQRQKNAAAMRKYRSNIKSNSERYRLHRRLECDRLQSFRRNMSPEQKERQRQLSCLRMRRLRERRKASGPAQRSLDNIPTTRLALAKRQKQREYWREKKRQQRLNMSSQKKRRYREKDAAYKRALRSTKKAQKAKSRVPDEHTATLESERFKTDAARRKAISRARNVLPKRSAEKFADVVAGVIHTSDEKRKEAMVKKGIVTDGSHESILHSVRDTCKSLKGQRKRYYVSQMCGFLDRKHGLKRHASRHLKIGYKYLMKYSKKNSPGLNPEQRKTRADVLSSEVLDSVQEFYQHPNVATELPNRKGLGKKAEKPKYVLQKSLEQTYRQYCDENPSSNIGKSKFAAVRPSNVLVQAKAKAYQCLCEYCTNITLKTKALNKAVNENKLDCIVVDAYHASALTLCPQDDCSKLANLSCIDRKCNKCGVQLVDAYLEPLLKVAGDYQLWWQHWGKTPIASAPGKTRVTLLRDNGSLSTLVGELKNELQSYPAHLLEARWQQSCFYSVSRSPPVGSVVLVMDYAENYSCLMQQEVQSAHWFILQITLHPMVAYYLCDCGKSNPVREALHIISEDMQHDAHAVHHYVTLATNHLTRSRGLMPTRLIKFSDGCGAQYKSKVPFSDLSHSSTDFGIPCVEHHFFGSRHGKNPCDGEGGIIKNAAIRAVKSGTAIINSAESLFDFCSKQLVRSTTNEDGECNHSRRTFFLVDRLSIKRDRPERTEVCTVPGTRQVHAAIGIKPYLIKKRRLSCFCDGCATDGNCHNAKYMSPWTEAVLQKKQHLKDVSVVTPSITIDYAASDVVDDADTFTEQVLKDLFSGALLPEKETPLPDKEALFHGYEALLPDKEVLPDKDALLPDTEKAHPSDKEFHEQNRNGPSLADQQLHIEEASSPRWRGIKIQQEQYYAVFYDNEFYIGRLLDLHGNEFMFKFLHRVRSANLRSKMYDWPTRSDYEKIHGKYIIDGPLTLVGNGPFTVKGLEKIENLYAGMKKTQAEL